VRAESSLTPEEEAAAREAAATERKAAAEAQREQMRRDRELFRDTARRATGGGTGGEAFPQGLYVERAARGGGDGDAPPPPGRSKASKDASGDVSGTSRRPLFELVLPKWAMQAALEATGAAGGTVLNEMRGHKRTQHGAVHAHETDRGDRGAAGGWGAREAEGGATAAMALPRAGRVGSQGPDGARDGTARKLNGEGAGVPAAQGAAVKVATLSGGRLLAEAERQAAVEAVRRRRGALETALGEARSPAEARRTQRELVAVMTLQGTVGREAVVVCSQLPGEDAMQEAAGRGVGVVGVAELMSEEEELIAEEPVGADDEGGEGGRGGRREEGVEVECFGGYSTSAISSISALADASSVSACAAASATPALIAQGDRSSLGTMGDTSLFSASVASSCVAEVSSATLMLSRGALGSAGTGAAGTDANAKPDVGHGLTGVAGAGAAPGGVSRAASGRRAKGGRPAPATKPSATCLLQ
jgi:hypothetical protein